MRLSIPKTLSSKPWLLVVFLFVAFIAWWVFFISIAVKNAPKTVPVVTEHAGH